MLPATLLHWYWPWLHPVLVSRPLPSSLSPLLSVHFLPSLPLFLLLLLTDPPLCAQSPPFFAQPNNPLPDPCHLPNPLLSASLALFCQFHYHQISYICDPAGILSRTEAELIDRRLQTFMASSLSPHPLNVTGCLCDPSRHCVARQPAWKDKRSGQIRIVVLIVRQASINSLKKCAAKLTRGKKQAQNSREDKGAAEKTAQRRHQQQREAAPSSDEIFDATNLFAHSTLKQLLLSDEKPPSRKICDPDLLIVYIMGWSSSSVSIPPFVARLFRRNLAHLAQQSQMERIVGAETSAFEVVSDQLNRAFQLITVFRSPQRAGSATVPPLPTGTVVPADLSDVHSIPTNPRTEQIPLWAILCSTALLSLALMAVLIAHWIGRRISAAHQARKGAHRMANGTARTHETTRRGQEVGGVPLKQKANATAGGHSVTFATGSATAGERERGGAERGGGGAQRQMKGSMMFRQFSRRRQQGTRTDRRGAQQQKI